MNSKNLSETVNQSGFPLQIGLAHHVDETSTHHGWRVLYTEHAWKNIANENGGFIDIVLQDKSGTSLMILECKRVLESSWTFLYPSTQVNSRRHVKSWVTHYISGNIGLYGWTDLTLEPRSPESQYCVIRGQDKSNPLIERIGSELISATEALASEEQPYHARSRNALRRYFSVIVTTANLKLCSFNPNDVSISDGMIKNPKFEDMPYVRFRKQLSTQPPKPDFTAGLAGIAYAKEHTVFVVNSEAMIDFLKLFEVDQT